MPAAKALGLEGPVIEVKLTPDRSDCFGVAGIARDLAAAGLGRLRAARTSRRSPRPGRPALRSRSTSRPATRSACPLFVGRMIRGVRNGPSPAWLQNRLKAIGLRPISALVDITNYLTFDLCRPLHVFDAAKLQGDLSLRFARPGEELLALDGRTYRLDDGMTVIADESGPVSLGGIMGGEGTGVTADTTDVVLEVALFDPLRTAATGRRLGIESDARTRFERGLDPELVLPATEFATRLILELCGGKPGEVVVAGAVPAPAPAVRFRRARLAAARRHRARPARRSSASWPALGFAAEGGPEEWQVQPPSWRHDVSTEACIVEELARLHGYDRIPPVPVTRGAAVGAGVLTPAQRRRAAVRRAVAELGYAEAVTWSFIPPEHAALFGAARAGPQAQPAQRRAVGDAAVAPAEPLGRGGAQPRAQAGRWRPVRARPALHRRHARRAGGGAGRRALRRGAAAALGRPPAAGGRHRRQGRRAGGARRAGRQARERAGRGRGAGLVPSRAARAACGRAGWCSPASASCTRASCASSTSRTGASHSSSTSTPCRCPSRAPARPARRLEPLPYPPVDRDFAFVVDDAVPAGDPARRHQGRRPPADPRGAAVRRLCRPGRRAGRSRWPWRCGCRRPTAR